jgi:hypothetical protein
MRNLLRWLLALFGLGKEDGVENPTETGESQFGFSAAMHDALEKDRFRDADVGTKFKIVDQWVVIAHPRQSPWHITYNVVVQQVG